MLMTDQVDRWWGSLTIEEKLDSYQLWCDYYYFSKNKPPPFYVFNSNLALKMGAWLLEDKPDAN